MKVTEPVVLKQTVGVVVEIATVGNSNTFTVAEPVCDWLQLGVVAEDTLTKSYTNGPTVPVGTDTVTESLPAVVVTVCGAPPFMV